MAKKKPAPKPAVKPKPKPVEPAGQKWDQDSVLDVIQSHRHSGEAWAFLRDCPNNTSIGKSREADAIAVGCWSSKGLTIHGYEVKVSRADWRAEIQNHEKSLEFMKLVDFWWLAAPPGVAELAEVPGNWGFIEVNKNPKGEYSAKIRKQASRLNREGAGAAGGMVPYGLFSAALRRAVKTDPGEQRLQKAIDEAYKNGHDAAQAYADQQKSRDQSYAEREAEQLREQIKHFEESTGFKVQRWHVEEQAAKFKRVVEICDFDPFRLESMAREAERIRLAALELSRFLGDAGAVDWMGWSNAVQCPDHHPTLYPDCFLCRCANVLRAAIIDRQGKPCVITPEAPKATPRQRVIDYQQQRERAEMDRQIDLFESAMEQGLPWPPGSAETVPIDQTDFRTDWDAIESEQNQPGADGLPPVVGQDLFDLADE